MAETSTTTYMNLVLPTPGQRLGPTWASDINTALTRIDQHDHSTIGKQLGSSALKIDADLSFTDLGSTAAVAYAATNVKYSGYSSQATALSSTSFPSSVYVTSGELYYNDAAGNQVQLTSAGAVSSTGVSSIQFASTTAALTGTATIAVADNLSYYYCDTSTAGVTVTLPAVGDSPAGRFFLIKDSTGTAATNNITVTASGTDFVDGAGTYIIASNYGSAMIISRGNSNAFDVV